MSLTYSPTAMGSDVARSKRQLWQRRLGQAVVAMLGLNRATALSTEIVQSIRPVIDVPTRHGVMHCIGGHGRLLWRARSFHEEEPETVAWLDALTPDDVLWDVGANVGMYAVYAAKFSGCRVFAFEPEAQNNALLIENIALNGVGARCVPVNMPLSRHSGFGYIDVRYVTKGGAYNHFDDGDGGSRPYTPDVPELGRTGAPAARQLLYGASIDELVADDRFAFPTHIKIDVDGLEAEIIKGAERTLRDPRLRGLLVELNRASDRDMAVPTILAEAGFQQVSERSNWLYRADRSREAENPTTNMIFARG